MYRLFIFTRGLTGDSKDGYSYINYYQSEKLHCDVIQSNQFTLSKSAFLLIIIYGIYVHLRVDYFWQELICTIKLWGICKWYAKFVDPNVEHRWNKWQHDPYYYAIMLYRNNCDWTSLRAPQSCKFSINSKCCMWFTLGYIFVTFGYICWLHFSREKCWLHFSPETSGREVSVTLSLPFGFASPVWNSHTAIVMIIQIYKLFISIFPSLYIYFGLLKPPFAFFFVEPFDSSDWNKWKSSIIQY